MFFILILRQHRYCWTYASLMQQSFTLFASYTHEADLSNLCTPVSELLCIHQ